MDLTIVAVYTICDDLLISLGHQDDTRAKMSDAEVMMTTLIAARYFAGNQQTAWFSVLKTLGYIPNMFGHSRFNRRLHQIAEHFQTLFQVLAEGFPYKQEGEVREPCELVAKGGTQTRCLCYWGRFYGRGPQFFQFFYR